MRIKMKLSNIAISGLTLACLSIACNVNAADEWLDVYGKINLSLDNVNQDNGDEQWELNSNASRFGLKGKGEVSPGLVAFYQMEWEIDITDDAKSSDDHIKARNQFVGLRGSFGEVLAGRHDTPTKKLQNKIDVFNDLIGDIKYTFNGEVRADNIIQYTSPKVGAFEAKLAFIPGECSEDAQLQGDCPVVADGIADGTSLSVEYDQNGLNLGISIDADVEDDGVDTTRIMAQYQMDGWQFGLLLQQTDNNGVDADGLMASVKYDQGDNSYKIQLINSDAWETGVSSKAIYRAQTSLGWDHKLAKNTKFYTYMTMAEVGATNDDHRTFGFGLEQKF